ncbi:MAG: tetratricopeptide repeat protein, partial [Verrucomicrobiota bacterium]
MKTSISSQLIWVTALLLAIGLLSLPAQEDSLESESASPAWTETDTRLANHYLKLLQGDPAYGKVLNLLWELYEKKEQTPLLLDYIGKAANSGALVPTLIHAHLLRKNEQIDEAREAYRSALENDASNPHALRALAEIADLQERFSKALSFYTRLAEVVPVSAEDGIAFRLRMASLQRTRGQSEKALSIWQGLLRAHPGNDSLRNQIVTQLLEAGETEAALEILQSLAESGSTREQLDALRELTTLYEFTSDFDGAVASARRGLRLLHFKNHDYAALFSQLVQIHERFERLEDLEESLAGAVGKANPTERSLYDLAEFYRLTANPEKEEGAMTQLVELLSSDLDYRLRLTRIQMRNDRYEAAATTLEEALDNQTNVPLHLILLRAQIALNDDNRVLAREIVESYIQEESPTKDAMGEIISFARENYLDQLVEKLLRTSFEEAVASRDGASAPAELARFLTERGRTRQALEALETFIEGAGESTIERSRRLFQVSLVLRELEEVQRGLDKLEEAIDLTPDRREYFTTRADFLVEAGRIEEAIKLLESLWEDEETYEERADIDQRLFSLLRGHFSSDSRMEGDGTLPQSGPIQNSAQYRRMAIAASQIGRSGDEPPPAELLEYYERIKTSATENPSAPRRYRAAWWALKLQDNQECYGQLTKATGEAGGPILEVEKMLLELAIQNERPTLMVSHLTTLAEIDPENEDEYLQRRAEMRFELGYEDEAIRELKRLAAKPDASLNTLNTLAKVYQRQGNSARQVEVWERAFREANVFEKRRIVKQLSNALIATGDPEGALRAQLTLIGEETDAVQRRKQLDVQLSTARSHFLLDWLLNEYREFAQQHPFDRFFPEALARVHRAAGNERDAFEEMKKAYYMSGREEGLLNELGDLADELGDLKSAIYYRRQLLARDEGGQIENWLTLIEMLEKDLRVDDADRLRVRLEGRFGRDPDFLSELTDHYLADGQWEAASRTLEKTVTLKTWDLAARLRYGLLLLDRGETARAQNVFNKLIEETEGVEYPSEIQSNILPLLRVANLPKEDRGAPGRELDPFIFTIESYPFLGGDLQDEIAEALQEPHPEFFFVPSEPHLIRLRAIEESAEIASANGTADDWLRSKIDPERPFAERLWAARHAQNREAFGLILRELPEPVTHHEIFTQAYCYLLAGNRVDLEDWAVLSSREGGKTAPRSWYVTMASLVLLKDATEDPLRDENFLLDTLSTFETPGSVAMHLFSELRQAEKFALALEVGKRMAEGPLSEHSSFLVALSQVAGWVGHREDRERFLVRSLENVRARSGSGASNHFLLALTEHLSLLEDDLARQKFLNDLGTHPDPGGIVTPSDELERDILIAFAANDWGDAIGGVSQLVQRQLDEIRPSHPDPDQVRHDQSQSWQRMRQVLTFYAKRIPVEAGNRETVTAAFEGENRIIPSDETVIAEFERFEIDRRLLGLEWLGAPERDALVDEMHRLFLEPDSGMELARNLGNHGFHREAIPVYLVEALRLSRDYAPLQGVFESCLEALEPGPALKLINQMNAREFPSPPGLTAEYLTEQHALFLFMSRDLERLISLGRAPSGARGAPPVSSRSHLPYQGALVEAYRLMGRDDALLRLLTHFRNEEEITTSQLLLGATILESQDRFEEALEWINAMQRDGSESAYDR